MKLGEVIKKERLRRDIEVKQIALQLRISLEEYLELEQGFSPVERWAPILGQIAIAFAVPTSRLLAVSGKSVDTATGQAGKLIKSHRKTRQMTIEEVAQQIGLPTEEYEAVEQGQSPIEKYGPLLLRFAEIIEQPIFNLFYPCGVPLDKLNDYP